MKLTEEQMQNILNDIQPSIIESAKIRLAQSMSETIEYQLKSQLSDYAKEWIKENIIPELEKELIESKEGLVKVAFLCVNNITEDLAKNLTLHAKDNLEKSWKRGEIVRALLG